MRAKYIGEVTEDRSLTFGKAYDVIVDRDGDFILFDDQGSQRIWLNPNRFQLLPDEPKAEWMQIRHEKEVEDGDLIVDKAHFINVVTGHKIGFSNISRIAWFNEELIEPEYADAFAALVGYTFKAGDAW